MPANPRKTYVMLNLRVQNVFTLDDENEVTPMIVVCIAINFVAVSGSLIQRSDEDQVDRWAAIHCGQD